MRVQRRGEAVVPPFGRRVLPRDAVHRLRHAPRGDDAQECVEVGIVVADGGVEGIGERSGGADVHRHARGATRAKQRFEHALGRGGVPSKERVAGKRSKDRLRGRDVREEHHLLHHLIRLAGDVHPDVERIGRLLVELETNLGRRQRERASLDATRAKRPRASIDATQIVRQRGFVVGVVHHRLRLGVRQRGVRFDDPLDEARRGAGRG